MNTLKAITPIALIIGIVFVGCGDQFLPEPLKGASISSRQSINQVFINLFPSREGKNNYQRTEEAIDNLENNGSDEK